MYKSIIKSYVEKLKKEDIIKYIENNNYQVSNKEIDIIYFYIKNYWEDFFANNQDIWRKLRNDISENTDIEIMTEFALRLGEGDRDSELCNINAACAKLKLAYDEAVCDRDSRAKLWRGVGLLAGCFAVVLLI